MKTKLALLAALPAWVLTAQAERALLNVSYDPTRQLYEQYNKLFRAHWKKKTGEDVTIHQSHGGSGKQARSVIDGVPADVVTLALAGDINNIVTRAKSIPPDWQSLLPHNSTPYRSTVIFVVRPGNPKNIRDWGDLAHDGIQVVTPNPKTSGGARWNYLAAWRWAEKEFRGDLVKIKGYIKKLYRHAPVLDTGATGSTITFVKRKIGDVCLVWENEAHLIAEEFPGQTEIVVPPSSILAEPSVAVVKKSATQKGNQDLAEAYLQFWYTPEAQDLAARNHFRPSDKKVLERHASRFPALELVDISHFGGWAEVQKTHFDHGGIFDQIIRR
jgi:sulfate transport system substrate-binding protein